MNSFIVFVSLALVAFVASQDVIVTGPFVAEDSVTSSSFCSIKNNAGASISFVTFTIQRDPTIAIYYPNSASKSSVGSISNGATGSGDYQILGPTGMHTVNVVVNYRKGSTWFNVTSTHQIKIGGEATEGKRSLAPRAGNGDVGIVTPSIGYAAFDSTPTWQNLEIKTGSASLTGVTYTVTSSNPAVLGIYYERSGNSLGVMAANSSRSPNFQMNGPSGMFTFDITINYRKGGVASSYTETVQVKISNDVATEGKRLAQSSHAFLPSAVAQNPTAVLGLAVGGIALIAIVAVVVVVAVVKRRTNQVIA